MLFVGGNKSGVYVLMSTFGSVVADEDDEEEEGKDGEFTTYVNYGQILGGDQDYAEEEDDEDFKPTDEPADYDIPEDEEDEAVGSVLGKHGRDEVDGKD